tara:strand:- start:148 stop:489 length:342 start_codon:yes stop_codon:yes gene_type:complete
MKKAMKYSLLPFTIRVLATPPLMLYLHKKFLKQKATIAKYPVIEKVGLAVVYVGMQGFFFTYTITGDIVLSLQPTAVIFLPYLLCRFLVELFAYVQYALDYIDEKLNRNNNTK